MFTHFLALALVAQFAALEGHVRDSRTHRGIPMAKVELWRAQTPLDHQFTDSEGRFRFAFLTTGEYTISVAAAGYNASSFEVDLPPTTYPVNIELLPNREPQKNVRPVVALREFLVPENARKEFDRARKDVQRQNCAAAIRHFENGLRIYAQEASAHNELGNCYRKLNQLDLAENAFKRASDLSDSVFVSLNLAEAYTAQQRFSDAEQVLLAALQKQPNAGDAYYGLSLVYFEQELLDKAEASALQAEKNVHRIADVHLVLAKIYNRKNKSEEAIAQLEMFVKEAPNDTQSKQVREAIKKWRSGSR